MTEEIARICKIISKILIKLQNSRYFSEFRFKNFALLITR